ncbi:mannose-1-phosphate guanylyltransferase/phosphomannomutase [Anoxybacillus tepidamans]|uniref:Mannose-1-phosphate guanylyltransferase/phosphomannomutase n=1 Tax=Anoxybacteroides tepidamans TaxID=265948 RepID=A0A7W8IQ67_9BACL|nr:sugar phosphate nucleotidyltransferase [Anoxybacillus tepidamans]MBB5324711.1 mannose-1-phosphate guanylyltransferase/phosphomannomutase [Anoxybacillus tepidamans]
MKGIIMAGGRGTRLRPLTCDVPKPMVPLVGKPVLEHTIEWLKRFGVTDIAITIQYLGETIKNYFGDGSRFGVNICYFEEDEPLGTAGSIKHAAPFIDDTFIVVSGDALTDFDLSEAVAFHRKRHALATIVMSQETHPLDYGGIIVSREGKVKQLIEKPKWNEVYSDFVNTGIYIFERDILQYIKENEKCDFSSDIFPTLLKNDAPLYAFLAKGYWLDIGTIQQYRKAHMDILKKHVHVSINGKELFPHVWVGENVQIEDGAVIMGPAFIGDGALIRKNVKIDAYTVIGANVQVGEHTSIKRSIIWDRVYIGRYCELRGSLLAGDTYVADHVELLEQSVIGSHCTLQPHVQVKPNIKIWPKKTIVEGTVVHSSVFWGKQTPQSLFGTRGIAGIANVEITPEYVSKLAAAYGSTLPIHRQVIVAGDGHPFTNLIKQAFVQGLHTSGICTAEWMESVTAPVVRYQLSQSSYDGGVYIFLDENERTVCIDLYDENGYPLDRFQEKTIEHAFVQEQIRRVPLEQIGFSNHYLHPSTSYIQAMQKQIHLPLRSSKAILVSESNVHHLVQQLFRDQHCEIVMFKNGSVHELADYMKTMNVLFALITKNDGEQFWIMDENGNIVTEEQLLSLYTIASLWFHPDRYVPIPNYAPSTLETVAGRLNGRVKRMKGARREMLRECPHPFHFCYDAVFAFVQLLQLLAVEARPLSQVIASIPHMHWLRDYVFCPWSARAVVMRKLMEDEIETNIDVNEGIKVYHPDGGWTFILPELDQPIFTIYSEAFDVQKARETMTYYIKKIRQYQNV